MRVSSMIRLLGTTAMIAGISTAAFATDIASLREMAKENFDVIPSMVPAVRDNAVTRDKVELGKMLFFDPRLSSSALPQSGHGRG